MRFVFCLLFAVFTCPAWAGNAFLFDKTNLTAEHANGGKTVLRVELADTPEKQARGLMYRTEMDENAGMLFDFKAPRPVTMWMANTPLSLDMLFFDRNGTINEIISGTVPFSRESIPSAFKSRGVLELNAGAAQRLGLKVGDKLLLLENGSKVR